MKNDTVTVLNTDTGRTGRIRRRLFDSPAFNPDGLLVEIEDNLSGCVDCGVEPSETEIIPIETEDPEEEDD